ncbi:LysR family transcriptional regulator [Oceanibacterium hippocampi]|uniref:HTH-type transcriptional regulator CysL n=1 Tax=Oceanibacterium hippocampi TaxID=745714 RepID=A0A1Y5RZV3_9PROT|nr:LysR family transcriptional regulator [Oceanibacterium hippocampi]SLN27989.1 HTH-type transcriptional regulator CysL [Oceanibacterium hippocampi]
MDIAQARTFLEVIASGSFVAAAERLHITQSTVSARIRALEGQLGRSLLDRGRAGVQMTAAGNQFYRHAAAMVRLWEQARHDVGLPEGMQATLAIGGHFSLWQGLLFPWIAALREAQPTLALRAEYGFSKDLMQALIDGTVDVAVIYAPEARPGFVVEPLLEEELVLASTESPAPPRPGDGYVFVDWGPEFQRDHRLNFPDLELPTLNSRLGALSLQFLTAFGGSGYFPRRVVAPGIAAGILHVNERAPVFSYPAYMVYPVAAPNEFLDIALDELRRVAQDAAPDSEGQA